MAYSAGSVAYGADRWPASEEQCGGAAPLVVRVLVVENVRVESVAVEQARGDAEEDARIALKARRATQEYKERAVGEAYCDRQ